MNAVQVNAENFTHFLLHDHLNQAIGIPFYQRLAVSIKGETPHLNAIAILLAGLCLGEAHGSNLRRHVNARRNPVIPHGLIPAADIGHGNLRFFKCRVCQHGLSVGIPYHINVWQTADQMGITHKRSLVHGKADFLGPQALHPWPTPQRHQDRLHRKLMRLSVLLVKHGILSDAGYLCTKAKIHAVLLQTLAGHGSHLRVHHRQNFLSHAAGRRYSG